MSAGRLEIETIEQALARYLRGEAQLPADPVRLAAVQAIRGTIGAAIYASQRRPIDSHHTALTIYREGAMREMLLTGELGSVQQIVAVDIYSNRPNGPAYLGQLLELLRVALTGYKGRMSRTEIGVITTESDDWLSAVRPVDGSDHWTHRGSLTFMVEHNQLVPGANT